MSRLLVKTSLVLLVCLLWLYGVSAQGASQATLSAPQADSFPRITTYLDVRDEQGDFVSGLAAGDLMVIENDQRVPVDVLEELRTGAQFVVALNPGRSFAIRDAQGNSRYDFLVQALRGWAEAHQDTHLDDLSLLATPGLERTHLADSTAWLAELEGYQVDLRAAVPSLDTLSRALDVAADPPSRPGMGRAVLLITPYPEGNPSAALRSMATRAVQAGTRVHVWLVASQDQFDSPAVAALAALAAATGGQYFAFSGAEPFPDIESYLAPLRKVYSLSYSSRIRSSGFHQLAVIVRGQGIEAQSPPQAMELKIAPPNPVFVSPPAQVVRSDGDQENPENLQPLTQEVEILIEFPDGHPRALQRTTLYVDGAIAAQNNTPPFERFSWDLSEYTADGRHLLLVEAVDSLGLSGISTETPVEISIELQPQTILSTFSRNATLLSSAAAGIAGAILLLILILGGRIGPRPRYLPLLQKRKRDDPVTQPVPTRFDDGRKPGRRRLSWTPHLPWPQPKARPQPLAYLAWYSNQEPQTKAKPIPVTAQDITLGSDPELATVVLDDPSVEGCHARLQRGADGGFQLSDQGSIAGTWINYAPISQGGSRLQDGDLIHIGRVGFRFSCGQDSQPHRPKVIFQDPAS